MELRRSHLAPQEILIKSFHSLLKGIRASSLSLPTPSSYRKVPTRSIGMSYQLLAKIFQGKSAYSTSPRKVSLYASPAKLWQIQYKGYDGQKIFYEFIAQTQNNPQFYSILCPDQSLIHISKYPTKKGLDNFLNSTGNFFRPQSPPHKELTMKYLGKVQALNKSQWCSPNEVANVFEEFFTDLTYHLPEYEQIFKVMKGLAATLKKTQPLHGQKASLNLNFKPVKEKRCLQALASQPLSIKSMTKTTHSNKTDTHLKDKARKVPPLNLRKITEINPKECEEESLEQVDVSDDSWKREVEDMKTFLSECQQIIVYVKNIEVKVYDIIPLYVYVAMIVLCLILGNVYYWV
eukprot:TRINITY_DN1574_c0_g1_i4.p1 TRINITY_DN1574_c0_g1~~TRINITY_DN1574_c0_g1_i4.p1  ORF type:complete len:348 (-),score=12.13 TRINITY_DN1574_c0_g1_i4:128-1171(-)